MKIQLAHSFEDIINTENLLEAWQEFVKGKRGKRDVQEFSLHFMDNILLLHEEFAGLTYRHGGYQAFNISDPKPRNIHKASVRDRLLHHALYRKLYPFFNRVLIADSFSCRIGKGTHKAINRFCEFSYKVSKNNTRTCRILKCDVKKFFASIDHAVLIAILRRYIPDKNILWLLAGVIESFSSGKTGIGLPLGNLTSQLLVNIYMNEFDQFAKHKLKTRYYIRYADDFVLFSANKDWLEKQTDYVGRFLQNKLKLTLHPDKVYIKTLASGVDFLGWINFPDHRVLRGATKRRMLKRIKNHPVPETLSSYLGLLQNRNANKLREKVLKQYLLSQD